MSFHAKIDDPSDGFTPEPRAATTESESHRKSVVDFFEGRFSWWMRVYGEDLPRGFFSYEMNRRKELVLAAVDDFIGERKGLNVIECGCGPGGILQDLPTQDHKVVGTDINFQYLSGMTDTCELATGLCCDLELMPFKERSFDLLICVGVLPYLRQDEKALAEMARLLKPGGLLILSNPSYYMLDKFLDPYYYICWPLRQIRRVLARKTTKDKSNHEYFSTAKIRRYRLKQLDSAYETEKLTKVSDRPVSFGPIKFWKKEFLKIEHSISLSAYLARLAETRYARFLLRIANHRVTCLVK